MRLRNYLMRQIVSELVHLFGGVRRYDEYPGLPTSNAVTKFTLQAMALSDRSDSISDAAIDRDCSSYHPAIAVGAALALFRIATSPSRVLHPVANQASLIPFCPRASASGICRACETLGFSHTQLRAHACMSCRGTPTVSSDLHPAVRPPASPLDAA